MFISDYEAMKIYECRSEDLIREAARERLIREIKSSSKSSIPMYLGFTAMLGSLLINWGEKLRKYSE